MASTFHYRVIQSSWGISVSITAVASLANEYPGIKIEVSPEVWLALGKAKLESSYIQQLSRGLKLVAHYISENNPLRSPIIITVLETIYDECDFQPEGLACAIAGWASQEFGFPEPKVPVFFDHKQNKYIFNFPSVED